jgi:hypothetical protein
VCGRVVTELGEASASDNCPGVSLARSGVPAGSLFPVGLTALTHTATDGAGNQASASQTVAVADATPPRLTLAGPPSVSLECRSPFVDPGAAASDACSGDLSAAIRVTGSVDVTQPASYTLGYGVEDAARNPASATRSVTVVDTLPPSVELLGAASMRLECGASFLDPGARASDLCAGDLSGAIRVSGSLDPRLRGSQTLTYSVSDPAGHASSVQRTVVVEDTTGPDLSRALASPSVLWPPNHKLVPVTVDVSVSDACDASPRCRIVSVASNEPVNGLGDGDSAPDWQVTGERTLMLRAERSGRGSGRLYSVGLVCTDAAGNESRGSAAVTVPHDQRGRR